MSFAVSFASASCLPCEVVVDEPVRQHHRAHLQPAVQQPLPRQVMQHRRPETADRPLLDGDQHLMVPRQLLDQRGIQRLGEAGIGDGGRQPPRRQFVRRAQCVGKPRPERQDRHAAAFADHASLAQLPHLPAVRQRHADAVAARIAQRASAGRRSTPRSPPHAPVPPRPTAPSARTPAGSPDRRGRSCRNASPRRCRPARPGPARSAPAGSGSPRRAPPGRRRAAGTSSRWRRTASSPRSPGRPRTSPPCCSAMPTSKQRSGNALPKRSSPVPDGIAAVIATMVGSRSASAISASANTLV